MPTQERTAARVLGFFLGAVAGFAVLIVAFQFASPNGSLGMWGMIFGIVLVIAIGIAILRTPALRTAGAGLVAGMAIGAITTAGACGGLLTLFVVSSG